MADSLWMDVCQWPEQLVDVKFDLQYRHCSLHLVEEPRGAVDRFGNELQDEVQVDFVLLQRTVRNPRHWTLGDRMATNPFAIRVVESL
jgi:hypothetical protein